MKRLKVGQIGIGHNHGEAKMLTVRKFPELFEVIGYAEDNEEWAEKRSGLKAYADLKRMSVREIIEKSDAVLVECDVQNLTKYAKQCVDAGRHIHMDKPASGTLAEYKELLYTAESKGFVVQMGYMYRYNPAVKKCVELAKNGELGEIYSVTAEMSTFHNHEYRRWLKSFHGGSMYIFGSHLVDLIVYLLGEPKSITSFLKHSGLDGVDCEDNNLAVLEYERALARIFVSSVEVNGYGRRQLNVCGSKGTIQIMPLENPCTAYYSNTKIADNPYADRKEKLAISEPSDGRYDEMMRDFYAYITGTRENPYTYEHDYLAQKVLCEIIGVIN